jgi:hypothetical protein
MADGALKPEEVIAHRFSVLPYMSGEDKKSSGNILVVVCDCGWIDMTDNEVLGMGWDAATLYRDHIAGLRVVPEDRPAPCHSMCARLVPSPNPDGDRKWVLRTPSGFHCNVHTDESARSHGFAIPAPEPTVVERAAKVLGETLGHGDEPELACALDRAGLLVRDGEQ